MKSVLSFMLLLFGCFSAISASEVIIEPEALTRLSDALLSLPLRQSERAKALDALKRERHSMPLSRKRSLMTEKIGRAYVAENLDSAMLYFNRAISEAKALGADDDLVRFRMQLYAMLPMRGITRESIDMFEDIDYATLSYENKRFYWQSAAELYHTAQMPYPDGIYKQAYLARTLTAIDSLKKYYPPQSPLIMYLDGHRSLLHGDMDMAVANFMEVLPELADKPELRAFAMMIVSDYYSDKPDSRQRYVSLLLSRAANSLGRGLVRPALLARLGEALIEEGEAELGRKCISLSLKTPDKSYADAYGRVDRSSYAHYLTDEATRSRRHLLVFSTLALLLTVSAAAVVFRQRRRVKALQSVVQNSEKYSTELLKSSDGEVQNSVNLAFFIFEMLQEFEVYVSRKLKTGQAKDLYSELEEGRYMRLQHEKLFEAFDSNFLSSYPSFVERLNELLLPERRLSLPEANRMTPELRIAAFLRLGISDSARIAHGLGLSVNTVYTYRNRLRGRAVDRDSFERDLREIR